MNPISSKNLTHLLVPDANVVKTEWEVKNSINKRTYKLIPRYTFRDFVKSCFHDYHKFLR